MVNNTVFKLKPQTNKLSSKVQSSAGAVSHKSMDMTMTVKKPDYATAINKLNGNVLSRILVNSRNYKKNIGNSTLGIRDTNTVVQETVATVQETVATVQETVATVQSTVSVTESADVITGEFFNLSKWPIEY